MRLAIVFFATLVLAGCGDSIEYDSSNVSIGKTIVFRTNMFYAEKLKSKVLDKETYKYGCYLLRENNMDTLVGSDYQGNKKVLIPVKRGINFSVTKYFRVTPWGIKSAFGTGYQMLVVVDENGRICTFVEPLVRDDEWVR